VVSLPDSSCSPLLVNLGWMKMLVMKNTLTFGGAVVCEPRYVEAIYFGAKQEGLAVTA